MNTRLEWIDYAKGIGIMLVVYGHALKGLVKANLNVNAHFFNISDTFIYFFHMPLFFMLSGLFAQKWLEKDSKKTFISKFKILLIPYFIWSFIQMTLKILFPYTANKQYMWGDLLSILYQPFDQYWFLYALFLCFTMIYIFKSVLKLNNVSILAFSFILYIVSTSNIIEFTIINQTLNKFIYFTAGLYFYGITQLDQTSSFFSTLLKYNKCTIFSFIVVSIFALITECYNPILLIIISFLGIISVILLSIKLTEYKLSWLSSLGVLSMQIYLLHTIASAGTRFILTKYLSIYDVTLNLLMGTLLGIIFPVLFYLLAKKIHIDKYIFAR